jgi:hypothetical protein
MQTKASISTSSAFGWGEGDATMGRGDVFVVNKTINAEDGISFGAWVESFPKGVVPLTSGQPMEKKSKIPTVVSKLVSSHENFFLLEKWDGIVIDADAETFSARLQRFDDGGHPISAVFSKDEIMPGQRDQIAIGAPFVWTIGYRDIGTTRHRESQIYFRRLGNWEPREISAGVKRSTALIESIGWK